ncbi:unnamed protein product [Medioppia subpectinata]|uniref:Uncharacterized protein n=1 Tax=Medioppia subpectinata TaxID=1979941 RepID=A0A7R9KI91_9ACAR|nr:unnamed protein product [Medioppia subpectinata]CAG2102665.1 unnamed protein product [Medioppia subpectinata]
MLSITSLVPLLIFTILCFSCKQISLAETTAAIGETVTDPDVELCDKTVITGGVVTDERIGYIFNDKYFWQMKGKQGIDGYASLIANKWPEILAPIRAAFVIPIETGFMTIFIVGDNWYGYQDGKMMSSGVTSVWPQFKDLDITIAFPFESKDSKIFVIYNKNRNYILYDFKSVENPKVLNSGQTEVRDGYLFFYGLMSDKTRKQGIQMFNSIMDAKAALSYSDDLIIISSQKFCRVQQDLQPLDKKCIASDNTAANLLGCPLDIKSRPSTTTVGTEFIGRTTKKFTGGGGKPRPDLSGVGGGNQFKPPAKAGLGTTVQTTTPVVAALSEKDSKNKKPDKSDFWAFVIIGVVVGIAFVALILVLIVSRISRKGRKGEVIVIK